MPKETKARATKGEGKPKKDPNAPKRNLSAYMFFSQAERENVKKENPEATFGELGKLLGAKWKEVSDEDKKPYIDMAAKDKERYEADMKAAGLDVKPSKAKKAAKKAEPEEDDDEE